MTRRRGQDPASADFPTIVSIEIARSLFNLQSFLEFSMMEMRNLSNNTGFFDTNLMLGFLHMFSQSGRLKSPMLQIRCVLTNPLINGTKG